MSRITCYALTAIACLIALESCDALVFGSAGVITTAVKDRDPAGQAFAELRQHQCAAADSHFTHLLAHDPDDQRALSGRGEARLCLGQYNDAIADYSRAISMDPKWFDYLGRGAAYKAKGDLPKAVSNFDAGIALNPKVPALYIYRGIALDAQGKTNDANADFSKVNALVSVKPTRLNYYAWVLATSPVSAYRDGPAAIKYATAACEGTSWKSPPELDTLAAAYAQDGKFDEAIRWQKSAIEALPEGHRNNQVFEERLTKYEKHEPIRETDPAWLF